MRLGTDFRLTMTLQFAGSGAAAERELTMAQLTLGMKLALGDGVIKNLELAVQWLRRATLNGSAEAALQLENMKTYY